MYKVFINEKRLSLNNQPESNHHNIKYHGSESIDEALDILENSSVSNICLYDDNLEKLWQYFKSYFNVIEAAGGLVTNLKQEILFIYRLSKWDLPKGKLEKNEDTEAAAIREVEEETGIKNIEIKDFLQNTYHIYKENKKNKTLKITHWYHMLHVGNDIPTPQIEEGISKVEWLPYKKVQENIFPQTFKNIQQVLNLYFSLNNII